MQNEPKVLLIDDDGDLLDSLTRALRTELPEIHFRTASRPDQGIALIKAENIAVIVSDLSLNAVEGTESGFKLLKSISALQPAARVIVLTGHAGVAEGVRALALGAASFIEKPADIKHLSALIRDALVQSKLRRDFDTLRSKSTDELMVFGGSALGQEVKALVLEAAESPLPVLITGETGTGKSVCARTIHTLSAKSANRFVRFQPTFGTADLVNSELFGHVKGAFTGATSDRKGLIAEADQGTLFLDEIDQLPRETQIALLGVLQDKTFRQLGSNIEKHAEFRILSASNGDMQGLVVAKTFRQDLYQRISHLQIQIPPLRSRLEDLPEFVAFFLKQLEAKEHLSVYSLEVEASEMLSTYNWPGNFRELGAVVESAAYRARREGRNSVTGGDLKGFNAKGARDETINNSSAFSEQVEAFKYKLVKAALLKNDNNQVKAAQELALDRSSLRRILERNT